MALDPSSRSRLTERTSMHFTGDSLFARIARTVCSAECLPRKELYEAWEVARRTRRHFRGGRIVDFAAGHGLLAYLLLVLDESSPEALCVDIRQPPSALRLATALEQQWPRLAGKARYAAVDIDSIALDPGDLVVSVHACGALTDRVLDRALSVRARVAVLPCCHDVTTCDPGGLEGWVDGATAIDATRVARLRAAGYHVRTMLIPATITPQNRLLIAEPSRT